MATIAEQLTSLADAKSAIKGAIISRGVPVSDTDPLRSYADKISNIGETVPDVRFGLGIDAFLGAVDADGKVNMPSMPTEVNIVGVKSTGLYAFSYCFSGSHIRRFVADDLEYVGEYSFSNCFASSIIERATFDGIEEINSSGVFGSCFKSCYNLTYLSFKKLKKINSYYGFTSAFASATSLTMSYDEIFPSLEELSGESVFSTGRTLKASEPITFSKIKKITGMTANYGAVFGSFSTKNTVWNFPSATEMTGHIWNVGASCPGEIHFAAANQAAIEACDGYANKWGFAGATIYFDL